MGGDKAFVSGLIDQFLTDAPALVDSARAGAATGDAGEVRRALHTLTSNAATFGATHLAVSSRQLEEQSRRAARSTVSGPVWIRLPTSSIGYVARSRRSRFHIREA